METAEGMILELKSAMCIVGACPGCGHCQYHTLTVLFWICGLLWLPFVAAICGIRAVVTAIFGGKRPVSLAWAARATPDADAPRVRLIRTWRRCTRSTPPRACARCCRACINSLTCVPDQDVAALHPGHTAASVRALLPRLHCFEEGACVVHHLFGAEVTELVRAAYGDAYLTAHLEVRVCRAFRLGLL